jgi:formamidopyrimidine-DNA glycosylase
MPELPEVEAARCLVERHCGGSTVKAVSQCEAGGGPRDGQWDDIVVCEGVDAARLAGALVGRKLASVRRKGKQLWFEMGGSGEHALFHFGMTGAFVVKGHAALKYQEFAVRDEQWPPKFCKLELTFANGARLAFADPRRLGRVRLRSDPEAEPPISKLAPDPLTGSGPDLAAFTAALRTTTAPIKAALLDQERAVCGVGNWVADDALYLAKVHPQAVSKKLGDAQVSALLAAVQTVCRVACEVGADSERFPKEWLFHARWGRESKPGTSRTLEDGRRVAFSTVAGRTTATVPAEQGRTPSYSEQQSEKTEKKQDKVKPSPKKRQRAGGAAASQTAPKKVKSEKAGKGKSKVEAEWEAAEAAWVALEAEAEVEPDDNDSGSAAGGGRGGGGAADVDESEEAAVRAEILRVASLRGVSKSLCPSEVPRKLFSGTEWRGKMDLVRSVGLRLAQEGKIVVMQKGQVLPDPAKAKGPIRYRISTG